MSSATNSRNDEIKTDCLIEAGGQRVALERDPHSQNLLNAISSGNAGAIHRVTRTLSRVR